MTVEEQADELLAQSARDRGRSLRKDGILNDRNLRLVRSREISMSDFKKEKN